MSKFIPLCVKKSGSNDYIAETGKPKLKFFDSDDVLGTLTYLIGYGSAFNCANVNKALQEEYQVAEIPTEIMNLQDPSSANPFPKDVSATNTAHAGGGQASALAISSYFTTLSTVATAGDSAKLPAVASSANKVIIVCNIGAAAATIYPQVGETLDKTTNGTFSLPVNGFIHFWCDGTQWFSIVASA